MASNYKKYIIPLPVCGLNDTDDDSLIDDRQVSKAVNVDFKADGFGICPGYEKYNITDFAANEVTSMVEYEKDAVKNLLVVSENKLKNADGTVIGDVASGDVKGVNIHYSFDANPAKDMLLYIDGTSYKTYDGTTLADVPAYTPTTEETVNPGGNIFLKSPDEIKKANFISLWMNRVWIIKGRTLRWSDVNKDTGHFANYFPDEFSHVLKYDATGLIVDRRPIIFTNDTIHVVMGDTANSSGLNPYRVEDIPSEVGTWSSRSVAVTNSGVIFLHRKGLYRLIETSNGYVVDKISKGEGLKSKSKCQKFIDSKTDDQIKNAYAVVGDDRYSLFFNDGTTLIFNLIEYNFTTYDSRLGNCGICFNGDVLTAKQYIYHQFKGLNNDGQAIVAEVEGKNSNLNLVAYLKEFDTWTISVRSDLRSYTLYPKYWMDFIEITDVMPVVCRISRWGEFRFGDRIRTIDVTLNRGIQLKKGDDKYSFKWGLRSEGLNEQWQVINMILDYKAQEMSN
jgi:hypothetical protein